VVLSKFICVYGWAIAIVLLVSGVIEFHLYIVGLWLSNWILVLMLKGNCLIDWTHVNNRQTEGHIIRCYFESETDRGTHYSVLFWEWDRQRDTLFGAILRVRQTEGHIIRCYFESETDSNTGIYRECFVLVWKSIFCISVLIRLNLACRNKRWGWAFGIDWAGFGFGGGVFWII
jgi:hypothetical protein